MPLSVQFVGDCAACRDDPGSIFSESEVQLKDCDILAGQLEAAITDRSAKVPNTRLGHAHGTDLR